MSHKDDKDNRCNKDKWNCDKCKTWNINNVECFNCSNMNMNLTFKSKCNDLRDVKDDDLRNVKDDKFIDNRYNDLKNNLISSSLPMLSSETNCIIKTRDSEKVKLDHTIALYQNGIYKYIPAIVSTYRNVVSYMKLKSEDECLSLPSKNIIRHPLNIILTPNDGDETELDLKDEYEKYSAVNKDRDKIKWCVLYPSDVNILDEKVVLSGSGEIVIGSNRFVVFL